MFAAVQTAVYIFQQQQNKNEEMKEESLSDDDAESLDNLEQLEGRGGSIPGHQNCPRDWQNKIMLMQNLTKCIIIV